MAVLDKVNEWTEKRKKELGLWKDIVEEDWSKGNYFDAISSGFAGLTDAVTLGGSTKLFEKVADTSFGQKIDADREKAAEDFKGMTDMAKEDLAKGDYFNAISLYASAGANSISNGALLKAAVWADENKDNIPGALYAKAGEAQSKFSKGVEEFASKIPGGTAMFNEASKVKSDSKDMLDRAQAARAEGDFYDARILATQAVVNNATFGGISKLQSVEDKMRESDNKVVQGVVGVNDAIKNTWKTAENALGGAIDKGVKEVVSKSREEQADAVSAGITGATAGAEAETQLQG